MTVEVYNQKGETLKVVALTNNGPYQKGERVVIVRRGSSWLILQYYVPGMIVEGLIRYDIDELNKKGINILNEKDSAPEIGNETLSEDTDAKIRILDTVIRQAMAENDLVKDNIKISCIYILLSPVLFILTTRWTGFCLVGSLGLLWFGAASLWITIRVQNNATKHMEDAKKLKEETLANS